MESLWGLVHSQAERAPGRLALQGTRSYSYRELTQCAGALADSLAERATPGTLVAVDAEGPASALLAFLAADRAGCAVLPLSRQSPEAHRMRILEDARPGLVLRAEDEGAFSVTGTEFPRNGERERSDMTGAAYVMYTSGSTGAPKGVIVSRAALIARLSGLARVPGLAPGESMLAMTAPSFDISLAEMLLPLTVGGQVIAAPDEARFDPQVFGEFVEAHAPDVVQATPSFWRLVTVSGWKGLPDGRIWCGGETLTPALAERLLPSCARLWNLYGPTEATIWATAAQVDSADSVTVGAPLPGSHVCLDGDLPGEGEILLYGQGLACGYLGKEELTARKFPLHDTPHGRRQVYRTGDRGRWQADGSLQFLGRDDFQVKLRGHRVELGEIECILEEHPEVVEGAAVLCDGDRPDRAFITAFVVAEGTTAEALTEWVRLRLPASHCPARIVLLPNLPRTTAGKVDRAALTEARR